MTYVYLKTQAFTGTNLSLNTIPLQVTSVGISVTKTIPSFPVPLSGVALGESITAALDLGMATKNISIGGIINDTVIRKTNVGNEDSLTFTAHEVAQMIAAGVDSTGFAKNQAFSELVILMPSFVGNDYQTRNGVDVNDRSSGTLIPLTFGSRGGADSKDNLGVPTPFSVFPDFSTDIGLSGFVRSFTTNFEAEAFDLTFQLEFEVASVVP
tara:strand:+ start:2126 stop:2758 length:633 start_codon:yes stop_codon:yes gene_type:complete